MKRCYKKRLISYLTKLTRIIEDYNIKNSLLQSEIVSNADFWDELVDLKMVRNPKTNKVEKLVEMTEEVKKIISLMDLENQ